MKAAHARLGSELRQCEIHYRQLADINLNLFERRSFEGWFGLIFEEIAHNAGAPCAYPRVHTHAVRRFPTGERHLIWLLHRMNGWDRRGLVTSDRALNPMKPGKLRQIVRNE